MYVPDDKPPKSWCPVDSTYSLPTADGRRWLAAVYSTKREYEPNVEQKKYILTPRDTDLFVTAVLYSAPAVQKGPPSQSAEWRAERKQLPPFPTAVSARAWASR